MLNKLRKCTLLYLSLRAFSQLAVTSLFKDQIFAEVYFLTLRLVLHIVCETRVTPIPSKRTRLVSFDLRV
jgi:hypothetical protein